MHEYSRRARMACCLLWLCLALAAPPAPATVRVVDDAGNSIQLHDPARRIVSLAPHATEMLYAIGAGPQLVGAVSYSDYPAEARELPRVGSYARLDLEAILALKPDLVVAWAGGNPPTQLEQLRAFGIPVYATDPRTVDAVADNLEQLGQLAGVDGSARQTANQFRAKLKDLHARYAAARPVRVFYEIWNQPLMTIGGEHFISDAMGLCGAHNVFAELSPPGAALMITEEAVLTADPDAIVASGMGESRPEWLDNWRRWSRLRAVKHDNLFFVPPDLLQRQGPRILEGVALLCGHLDVVRGRLEQAPPNE